MTDFPPSHQFMRFMSPLSQQRADRLIDFLAEGLTGEVLDVGCGWAEFLLQVLAAAPAARGLGLDLDEASIIHGRALAEARGLADRVTLLAEDGWDAEATPDAAICRQPAARLPQCASRAAQSAASRRTIHPRGRDLVDDTQARSSGTAVRSPRRVRLSRRAHRDRSRRRLPARPRQRGDHRQWDEFETGFTAPLSRWLSENPEHQDADAVRAREATQRAGYFDGYRDVLGMAYLGLIAV